MSIFNHNSQNLYMYIYIYIHINLKNIYASVAFYVILYIFQK